MSAVSLNNFVKITQSELNSNNEELNKKLEEAAQFGFFYVEMPQDCKSKVQSAVNFTNCFPEEIKTAQFEGLSGYNDRSTHQVESIYLEKKYWKEKLTDELNDLAINMHNLAIDVLKKILTVCNITTDEDQAKITGNATGNKGDTYFTFNHYKPEKPFEGLGAHCDFGQITLLFINQKGLQVQNQGNWIDVDPEDNYFIINFGAALQQSINDDSLLKAAMHRVKQVVEDRISFGIFVDNAFDSSMHKVEDGNIIDTKVLFSNYIEENFTKFHPE